MFVNDVDNMGGENALRRTRKPCRPRPEFESVRRREERQEGIEQFLLIHSRIHLVIQKE